MRQDIQILSSYDAKWKKTKEGKYMYRHAPL